MVLSEAVRHKIFLMEEAINFPASLLPHPNYKWENVPMVPYSDLRGAVNSLVEKGRRAAITTGFYIPDGSPPAVETDGPPGALVLAEGFKDMGMEVVLISDLYALSALRSGLEILGRTEKEIPILSIPMEYPDEDPASSLSLHFVQEFFNGPMGRDLTHFVYIERVGPNHSLESFLSRTPSDPDLLKEFETILPLPMRNRCYNSRLKDITPLTGKTHLFVEVQKKMKLPIETIGMADRGNEIGSGRIPWRVFKNLSEDHREAIFCCRIKTDYLITSGISNWAGYALLAGLALAKGRPDILERVTPEQEGKVLDYLIYHGPAVDGITYKQDYSVDGIDFSAYMKVIERLKEIAFE